jgi:nucleotide-binding universal stress UspA family protein
MISKFLLATDGSPEAWKSLEFAVELASQAGAAVTILTVLNEKSLLPASVREMPGPGPLTEPVADYLRQVAEKILEEAARYCEEKGVPATITIRNGEPVAEILKEAEESRADLIAMGSRGRSSLEAILLGSVTSGVIHQDAKFPVLVVRS